MKPAFINVILNKNSKNKPLDVFYFKEDKTSPAIFYFFNSTYFSLCQQSNMENRRVLVSSKII